MDIDEKGENDTKIYCTKNIHEKNGGATTGQENVQWNRGKLAFGAFEKCMGQRKNWEIAIKNGKNELTGETRT